jgi:hypothetical protein
MGKDLRRPGGSRAKCLILGCLLAAGVAHCPKACAARAGNFPVGDWYGEDRQGDVTVFSITHFKRGGSYSTDVRVCQSSRTREHKESGHWTLAGGMLNLAVENIDGRSVSHAIGLRTISNDGHVWVSQLADGDALARVGPRVSKSLLVGADSKLPGCDTIS